MADEFVDKTIEKAKAQVAALAEQLRVKKLMVNGLCEMADRPPFYTDIDVETKPTSIVQRDDEFYGKPLATVVRTILDRRQASNLGAASVNEIYAAMVDGGYHFGGKNEDNNKRGLYVTLGKNSAFHKLPSNGRYGLREWYPDIKNTKDAKAKSNGVDAVSDDDKPLHEELQAEEDSQSTSPVKSAK